MSVERREAPRVRLNPKCLFCDVLAEPTLILRIEDKAIRGWRCPKCGFTLIHPEEIPKAMDFLKETMKLKT